MAYMRSQSGPVYLGIDPGKTGAVAVVDQIGRLVELNDSPQTHKERADLVRSLSQTYDVALVAIERVSGAAHTFKSKNTGQPVRMSASSAFKLGADAGGWEMACACFDLPVILPTPIQWQRRVIGPRPKVKGIKDIKHWVAAHVSRRWPTAEIRGPRGGLKTGRADALVIAEAARLESVGARNQVAA